MHRLNNPVVIVSAKTSCRFKSTSSYQYIQKSSLPMLHFQRSLPRLPIPALEKTCERYLNAQKPLLSESEFSKTSKLVQEFQKGDAPQLQSFLIDTDKSNKHTSYISKPWFDMYLSDRAPLPLNYNPFLSFRPDEREGFNDPVIRASNLVISSIRFMRSLRENVLEPEVFHLNPAKSDTEKFRKVVKLVPNFIATYVAYAFKAFPLDMSQYQGLFEATRIPEVGKDRIQRSSNSKHLVVFINGHPFSVDVLDSQGNLEEPSVIYARLSHVYAMGSQLQQSEYPLGALTTENRDTWANIRKHLVQIGNQDALNTIDSALFCLCFDSNSSFDEKNPVPIMREQLFESTNRWYDKSFSLYVAKDGTSAVNFEHSWGDGVAVLRYFNEVYKDTTANSFVHPQTVKAQDDLKKSVHHIPIALDETAKTGILNAVKNHSKIAQNLDMNFLYSTITRDSCKQTKTSPDSVMQLAFQLAYFKQHQKFVATYESCSTAAFKHGRTETVRPCTNETRKFCESISSGKSNPKELRVMLDACSKTHNQLTKEAAMGQGFDRHLFGLRHTAKLNGLPVPEVFKDPNYAAINHNILSTSTLSAPGLLAGGFGPVVRDGYGVGYNISAYMTGCLVTNYKDTTDGVDFVQCLTEAFKEVEEIMKVKNN